MKNLLLTCVVCKPQLLLLSLLVMHGACAGVSQAEYDALIQSTKGDLSREQLAPALEQLQRWHLAEPDQLRMVYDLAALLDKAGDFAASESFYSPIIESTHRATQSTPLRMQRSKLAIFMKLPKPIRYSFLKTAST